MIIAPLLLSGCASEPVTNELSPGPVAEAVPAAPARAPLANPYLRERQPVPADAQRSFHRAQALIEAQDWQGALLELHSLAESYPQLSGPCLDLAQVYQQLGDADLADQWFQQTIANNDRNISAYNEYGVFLRRQGRFDKAEAIYLQALEQWEASADTHRNIGILYDLYVGKPEQALQHYHRYQALTGDRDREVAGWIADLERRQQYGEEG